MTLKKIYRRLPLPLLLLTRRATADQAVIRQRPPYFGKPGVSFIGICVTCQSGSLKAVALGLLGDLLGNISKCCRLRSRPMVRGRPCIEASDRIGQARPSSGRSYSG